MEVVRERGGHEAPTLGARVKLRDRKARRQIPMPLSAQHIRLAVTIDTHVGEVLAQGGGDEALLMSMADDMGTFKQLLDTCTSADMDALCERYDGFSRFAKLLERLAGGIADGSIPVPE
jgi:hypothetical protein